MELNGKENLDGVYREIGLHKKSHGTVLYVIIKNVTVLWKNSMPYLFLENFQQRALFKN